MLFVEMSKPLNQRMIGDSCEASCVSFSTLAETLCLGKNAALETC